MKIGFYLLLMKKFHYLFLVSLNVLIPPDNISIQYLQPINNTECIHSSVTFLSEYCNLLPSLVYIETAAAGPSEYQIIDSI